MIAQATTTSLTTESIRYLCVKLIWAGLMPYYVKRTALDKAQTNRLAFSLWGILMERPAHLEIALRPQNNPNP